MSRKSFVQKSLKRGSIASIKCNCQACQKKGSPFSNSELKKLGLDPKKVKNKNGHFIGS